MAQTDRDNPNAITVDAILRGLTDRPNVQSTLILSRKDGSIIRATGLIAPDKQKTTNAGAQYRWSGITKDSQKKESGNGEDKAADDHEQAEEVQTKDTPAEVLATAIFDFVTNASSLGGTLGSISREVGRSSGGGYGDGSASMQELASEEDSPRSREDEVQLLRLRTKNQEIIIFPDANYICCVVQKMGKAGTAGDRK